jgi:DUF4097 and DUF4098 domain-containing protein YvlB
MLRRNKLNFAAGAFAATALLAGCGSSATSKVIGRTTVSGRSPDLPVPAIGAITAGQSKSTYTETSGQGDSCTTIRQTGAEASANPPIEQKSDVIRVGKELGTLNGVSVDYAIELPRNSEVTTSVASGSQTISDLQGPVKIESASGSIVVSRIDRSVQVNTASDSISVQDVGDDLHANTASGSVNAVNVKGDVRIRAISSSITVSQPGARVEAATTAGSVDITGAANDVNANSVSGRVSVKGNPSGNGYWNLKTTSGSVEVAVPSSANFHLSAQAVSGDITAGIPIVIEDQDKHSLRARVGNAGGRVEIHTVSGGIRLQPAS